MNVELITIGDELLLGFTVDTNAAFLGRALADAGIVLTLRTTVGDDEHAISDAVARALERADGVITTGGLGPTSDDRSRHAIAALFGRRIVFHEPTFGAIQERWKRLGLGELPATNREQAMIPEGATLLTNRHGSAPGIWMENAEGKWIAMMPGVPREMKGMFAEEVLPLVRAKAGAHVMVIASRTIRTTGIAESRISDAVRDIALPESISLAYLPGWEGVDLRVTCERMPRETADDRLQRAVDAITPAIAAYVYGNEGDDLAVLVIDTLRARQMTLAVAESCTGGMLGMRLTSMPGSSDVFRGGVIAYDNAVKMAQLGVREETLREHGAVSDATALEMAAGARTATGASIGIGITGIAGPGGGTETKPVGLVSIAVVGAGEPVARSSRFIGDRDEVRRRGTQAALEMVRRRTFLSGAP